MSLIWHIGDCIDMQIGTDMQSVLSSVCLTIIRDIVYLVTRSYLGIIACSRIWCMISEMSVNIASVLINDLRSYHL